MGTSLQPTGAGWIFGPRIGSYGTDYVLRADVAEFGLGANLPTQAVYFDGLTAGGRRLDGGRTYVLRFAPGQLPPVRTGDGFWSITMYSADRFLVPNPIGRYSIGDRTPELATGADGSLEVYLSATAPPGHQANWLPAPPGRFSVVLRIYAPRPAAVDGGWTPPAITRVG